MAQSVDLVTGSAGFIGSHLVDRLLGDGRWVRVVDNFSTGRRANIAQYATNERLDLIEGDFAEDSIARAACVGVERVFHLAARADVVPSIEHPDENFRANVDGVFTIVKAARANRVRRFVYAASSSCYGIPDKYPTPEDAPS